MSSIKVGLSSEPTKNLKRKRSSDETEKDSESPMQPRRRVKILDESTTSGDEIIPSRERRNEGSESILESSFQNGISPAIRDRLFGKERYSLSTSEKCSSPHSEIRNSEKYSSNFTPRESKYSPATCKESYSTPRRGKPTTVKYGGPHSTPRNKASNSYYLANPWVADFSRSSKEGSSTPLSRPRGSSAKVSNTPLLYGYQLLGDSLLVRFADKVLHDRAVIGENGKFFNGLCVSGQTIDGLIEKVLNTEQPLEKKVIVLIGTNDFIKGFSVTEVKKCMQRLMDVLEDRIETMVVLTVPPIPRISSQPSYWDDWEEYNEWIKSLDDGSRIRVIDTSAIFLNSPRDPDISLYESFMGYGRRKRRDLIHINVEGLERLLRELRFQIIKFRKSAEKEQKKGTRRKVTVML